MDEIGCGLKQYRVVKKYVSNHLYFNRYLCSLCYLYRSNRPEKRPVIGVSPPRDWTFKIL